MASVTFLNPAVSRTFRVLDVSLTQRRFLFDTPVIDAPGLFIYLYRSVHALPTPGPR
jgi:hypothetical protein